MNLRRGVLSLALLFAATACGAGSSPTDPTAIRLTVTLNPAWSITQLELHGEENDTLIPAKPKTLASGDTVLLEVKDSFAGKPLAFDVWGLSKGQRVASAKVTTKPILQKTVDVGVDLSHLPCGA